MRRSILERATVLALGLAVPLALACGGGEPGGEMEMGQDTAQQEMTPSPGAEMQPTTADLQAMGESGVSGEVSFARQGGSLEVTVNAEAVPSAGAHASHIHQGTCDQPGGVVVPLNDVSVQGGTGEATSTVDATQLEAGSSYLVMVHGSEGAPIGCAEVPSSVVEGGGM